MFPTTKNILFSNGVEDGFEGKGQAWEERAAALLEQDDKLKATYERAYIQGKDLKEVVLQKWSVQFEKSKAQVHQDFNGALHTWFKRTHAVLLPIANLQEDAFHKFGFQEATMPVQKIDTLWREGARRVSLGHLLKHCFARQAYNWYKEVLECYFVILYQNKPLAEDLKTIDSNIEVIIQHLSNYD